MKFSEITALAVLGSNVCVAAYEIPNYKVIGKIVDEYLEQDSEGGEWSQECRDESAGVQVCVVGAIEADPAWGTRVGQAGETLEACTKGWTITDQAEWEKCLTPYFTLLSEKCDLSASLEACFGEDVHFAAEAAQDIEYAAMIATDAAFLGEEPVEEDPCSIAEDALDACASEAAAADPVWAAGFYIAQGKFTACVLSKTYWGVTDPAEFLECQEITLTYIESRCDLTAFREACSTSDILDFHLDLAEDLKLDMNEEEVVADEIAEYSVPSAECQEAISNMQVCVSEALAADPAWQADLDSAQQKAMECVQSKIDAGGIDQAGFQECQEEQWSVVQQRCDATAFREACLPSDILDFHLDLAEDLKLEKIAEEVVAEEFEE